MKIQIPDALKQDAPQNVWGKILTATPVIMTVIATMLAGLASSEMTRAQYARSLAAQQQSKAGDQWSFFQAKRLRGAMQRSTLDLLQATAELRPLDASALGKSGAEFNAVLGALQKTELPPLPAAVELNPTVKTALELLEAAKPDEEIAALLASLNAQILIDAVRAARDRADAFDAATKPVNQAIDQLEKKLGGADKQLLRDFTAARLRYTAARYDAEARLNQSVAQLLELQVRKSNLTAERHHRRSQRFFFGMLAAQAAVIVSTFSLAARQRSFLWMLAAAAGLAALGFAIYVYFYV
ncbi:MAG: DUF4337 family protein [Verrucomicrobia bacterium]|nr:DUF4337 family protein [Verrucomicrobiota bacterium]